MTGFINYVMNDSGSRMYYEPDDRIDRENLGKRIKLEYQGVDEDKHGPLQFPPSTGIISGYSRHHSDLAFYGTSTWYVVDLDNRLRGRDNLGYKINCKRVILSPIYMEGERDISLKIHRGEEVEAWASAVPWWYIFRIPKEITMKISNRLHTFGTAKIRVIE